MRTEHYDAAPERLEQAKSALTGVRVLVVDADGATRRDVATLFKKVAAEVSDVADGGQAVYALHQAHECGVPIELVMLELTLPRFSGMEVLALIRKDSAFRGIAVVVLTAVKEKRALQRCARLGAAAVLLKPPMPQQILDAAVAALATSGEAAEDKTPGAEVPRAVAPAERNGSALSVLGLPLRFEGFPDDEPCALRPGYLRCPFCGTIFTAPRLVYRALRADPNDCCAIGLYRGPLEKPFLEYVLVEMIVCPGCLYTHDRGGFHRFARSGKLSFEQVRNAPGDRWERSFLPIRAPLQKAVAAQTDRRLNSAQAAGNNGRALFRLSRDDPTIPRTYADALIAFDLALDCAATMVSFCRAEIAARVQHKAVAFLLKRSHCQRLLAERHLGTAAEAAWNEKRRAGLHEAFEMVMTIQTVEFRILEERLVCLARRFCLADELLEHAQDDDTRQTLEAHRDQAWADLKTIHDEQRESHDGRSVDVARHFLDPLASRRHEVRRNRRSNA